MKITKTQFKALMKECLTELINEGVFDKKLEQIAEGRVSPGYLPQSANPVNSQVNLPSGVNPRILEAVNIATAGKQGGAKSLFQEILMDTAMTTLQKQLEGVGAAGLAEETPLSQAEAAADEAQLHAISGGNPSRWALAAFGGKKKP